MEIKQRDSSGAIIIGCDHAAYLLKEKVKSTGNFEDTFLELTGGTKYGDLLRYL